MGPAALLRGPDNRPRQASSGTDTTKRAVSAQLREMTRRVDAGAAARDAAALFGTFATRWLESSLPASNRKSTTKLLYAGLTRNHIIGSDLGQLPMKNLRPASVERFVTQLRAKGHSRTPPFDRSTRSPER